MEIVVSYGISEDAKGPTQQFVHLVDIHKSSLVTAIITILIFAISA